MDTYNVLMKKILSIPFISPETLCPLLSNCNHLKKLVFSISAHSGVLKSKDASDSPFVKKYQVQELCLEEVQSERENRSGFPAEIDFQQESKKNPVQGSGFFTSV
jgi:hypothetical protein